MALLLAAFAFAAPASAAKLVGNTNAGSATLTFSPIGGGAVFAQSFTTGSHSKGYKLTGVNLGLTRQSTGAAPSYSVSVYSASSGDPGTSLDKLKNPTSLPTSFELVSFTASGSGIDLAANTTYFVVVEVDSGSTVVDIVVTTSNAEDSGAAPGWSVADDARGKASGGSWQIGTSAVLVAVHGSSLNGAPTPGTTSQRQPVVKRALAAVAARTVAGALDNIGARLGDAVPAAGLSLAGESVPLGTAGTALPEDARSGGSRGMTAGELLGSSAFSLALGAAKGAPGLDPAARRWSVWGRGDLGTFGGRPEPGMRYEGETRTGWLGIDARAGRWVAGLAASHGIGEADYGFDGGDDPSERGRLETELTALYPYGRWTLPDGLELRGLLGAGTGRLRHRPGGGAPAEASDLTMWMASAGLRRKLPPVAGFALRVRGDASFGQIGTATGPAEIDGLTANSWRLRAGPEASRRFEAGNGRSYTPFLEVAARRDGGDGVTGAGLEIAGGVRYEAPRLQIETRGRWLAAHTQKGTEERGVSAIVRMRPKADGRGMSLTLSPRWGAGTGGARALWRDEMPNLAGGAASGGNAASLDARTGYGFGVTPYGVVTPFAETGLSGGGDSRRLRLGTRFDAARMRLGVEVAGERRESVAAQPEHQFRLDARLRF